MAENFIEFLRNVILVLNSKDSESITKFTSLINDDIEKIKSCNFDKDKIIKILNTVIEYYKEIKISTNPYLWMELAGIGACRLDLAQNTTNVQVQSTQSAKSVAMNMQAPIQQTSQPVIQQQPKPQIQPQQLQKPVETKAVEEKVIETAPVRPIVEKVVQAPQATQVPPEIAQNQDGVQIWTNILGAIQSLPARAFYSGVAKFVGIENNKIKLGFLHDNALTQAKSEMKLSQLQNALKATYQGYEIEFTKIDANTRVIEVKPKFAPPPRPQAQMNTPAQAQEQINTQNPIKQEEPPSQNEEEETNKVEKKHYSQKVQEMIEQFNGRIID